jgi:hypothetical protein
VCAAMVVGAAIGALVLFGGKSETTARPKKAEPETKVAASGAKPGIDRSRTPRLTRRWEKSLEHAPLAARFTADGKFAVVRESMRTTIRVLAKADGEPGGDFTEGISTAVDFTPLANGAVASWHDEEPFAVVWDPKNGRGIGKLQLDVAERTAGLRMFECSPDARYIVSGTVPRGGSRSEKEVGRVAVFDTDTNAVVLKDLQVRGPKFQFTSDERLVIADLDRVRIYKLPVDASAGTSIMVENGDQSRGKVLACSADGSVMLHPGTWKGMRVIAVSASACKDLMSLSPDYLTTAGAVSSDGKSIAVCSKPAKGATSGFIDVIDVPGGKVLATFPLSTADAVAMEFSPDNASLVVCRAGRKVLMLDLP